MNVRLSVDEEVLQKARRRAEALGTSLNQLVRDYLEQLAGNTDPHADAAEFERLSRLAKAISREWKFDREELHSRQDAARRKCLRQRR
jgi:antitoxin component of RelBE/YafQ-DinJ toxin-antitoxin module